jgi:bacillithiol system protein YtxJ
MNVMAKKIEIYGPEEIDNLLNYINENNVELIIGKFSPYCSISHDAERTFDKWIAGVGDRLAFIKVNVVSERKLSQAIAEKFNVKHQSPQILWISAGGNVKWHASHYDINTISLNKNLDKEKPGTVDRVNSLGRSSDLPHRLH